MNNWLANTPKAQILIVDDNHDNLRMLTQILSERGYTVRPVPNGTMAISSAKAAPPDLILLDIMMPSMSGYDVCERLKADERTHAIPVIFISAKYEVLDKIKAFSLGGVDYITKPFQAEEILARIKTHLTLRNLQKALQDQNVQLQQEITEREQAEATIRSLNAELEQRVKHRTAELEAVNRELRQFVYAASHDLKTPLRGISQLAYWIVEEYANIFDQKGQEMCTLLINRVKRLDKLINSILEYSNVRRTQEKETLINLNTLISTVIAELAPPMHIHITVENELPHITGEKRHFEKVFHHLLDNAITFIDKAQGDITIRTVVEGSYWVFKITDNGPGIHAKYHEKIFQIFQTLAPPDEHERIGIGLALVKKIIELYRGRVWVESTIGKGSTFAFALPKEKFFPELT